MVAAATEMGRTGLVTTTVGPTRELDAEASMNAAQFQEAAAEGAAGQANGREFRERIGRPEPRTSPLSVT